MNNLEISYKDFADFVEKTQGTLFRVWFKDELGKDQDLECDFLYFTTVIPVYGDYLVGVTSDLDDDLVYQTFYLLSNIHFAFCNKDQDDDE